MQRGPGKHHKPARLLLSNLALWIKCQDSQATYLGGLSHVAGQRSAGVRTLELDSRDLASIGALLLPPAPQTVCGHGSFSEVGVLRFRDSAVT